MPVHTFGRKKSPLVIRRCNKRLGVVADFWVSELANAMVSYDFSPTLRLGKKPATGAQAKPSRGRTMLRQRKCKEGPKRAEKEGEKGKKLEKL